MSELVKVHQLNETEFFAVWRDEIGTYTAIHDAAGRPTVHDRSITVPRLTAADMAAAIQPRHPAYALAEKGTAARPQLARRFDKAARLVEDGRVRLTGPETAVVRGDSGSYRVTGASSRTCTCAWQIHHPGDWCSHGLAARMARALNQTIETPALAAAAEASWQQEKLRRQQAAQKGREMEKAAQRQARRDGLGAERWLLIHRANGHNVLPTDKYQRAYGRPEELAAVKAQVLHELFPDKYPAPAGTGGHDV